MSGLLGCLSHRGRQQIGNAAEQHAVEYLNQQGLILITKNYRCRYGEIDLIMRENDILVFVEVRYRQHHHFGSSAETIDYRKQRKLSVTAQCYLQRQRLTDKVKCRFDVIAFNQPSAVQPIAWIQNAF